MRILRRVSQCTLVAVATIVPMASAQAYVGPGLGLGTLAVIAGVIGSVFLAIFAIAWYPLKRLLKRRKSDSQTKEQGSAEPQP